VSAIQEVASTTALKVVKRTHDCDFCLMSAAQRACASTLDLSVRRVGIKTIVKSQVNIVDVRSGR
jgi:hypothetical protein